MVEESRQRRWNEAHQADGRGREQQLPPAHEVEDPEGFQEIDSPTLRHLDVRQNLRLNRRDADGGFSSLVADFDSCSDGSDQSDNEYLVYPVDSDSDESSGGRRSRHSDHQSRLQYYQVLGRLHPDYPTDEEPEQPAPEYRYSRRHSSPGERREFRPGEGLGLGLYRHAEHWRNRTHRLQQVVPSPRVFTQPVPQVQRELEDPSYRQFYTPRREGTRTYFVPVSQVSDVARNVPRPSDASLLAPRALGDVDGSDIGRHHSRLGR